MTIIKTKRLILRPWRDADMESFAKLNADPRVMEFFPLPLSRDESDQMVNRMKAKIEERGWGLWAVSVIGTDECIGFIGLNDVDKTLFLPAVEVGWRLAYDHWGKGYAPEGAAACLKYGFETLNLPEIVSFTAALNVRSMSVMEKIGMHRDPADDFDHPKLPEGHKLKPHVLYRLKQSEWKTKTE